MYLIEKISNKIGIKIALLLKLDKDHEEIITYGAFNLFQILLSIFWIIVFGFIFGVLLESVIILFTISLLRKYSGGVHSNSPNRCIVIGTTVSIVLALMVKKILCYLDVKLIIILTAISFLYSYFTILKYAPVDSPAKPIKKIETKNKFKKTSILILNISIISIIE
ncbi:accessory protein regulator protein B [Clostridium acetireducens DSM 10703]|uniref:Accessory protein regulator protein B n=1 Tax=Clostridium acetireducens DSM 10703 TaxID=1121290 RepID=A0A1E8EWA8_9CLOT|nr:accessory gene regulator B family protein [Clostridium acetireducens]OFI01557.1 accessory protein regulator protein B [Clostridium acetireducens DSM 10703]